MRKPSSFVEFSLKDLVNGEKCSSNLLAACKVASYKNYDYQQNFVTLECLKFVHL